MLLTVAGHCSVWVSAELEANGGLIALADMPWIMPKTTCKVSDAIRMGTTIAAPVWQGRNGHQVAFSSIFRGQFMALDGDYGAKNHAT
ncbi:MAG: NTP transferase domain-containing protein [Steroidobacteraceae bacterium]